MTTPLQIIRAVRELLADSRRWIKGRWSGRRDERGVVVPADSPLAAGLGANCWCLGGAINTALNMNLREAPLPTFTELRSDVERELLTTLGEPLPAIYLYNDRASTSHADILSLLDRTIERLAPEAA